jgi:hypothetical protein
VIYGLVASEQLVNKVVMPTDLLTRQTVATTFCKDALDLGHKHNFFKSLREKFLPPDSEKHKSPIWHRNNVAKSVKYLRKLKHFPENYKWSYSMLLDEKVFPS